MPRNAIIGLVVTTCLMYGVLQVKALRELTGKRRATGAKYLGVAAGLLMFMLHLLWGSIGAAAFEVYFLVVAMPVAIVHLGILLGQEHRRKIGRVW